MAVYNQCALVLLYLVSVYGQYQEIKSTLSKCHRKSAQFDNCLRKAFNDIRPYFQSGIPELGVSSFDPHFAEVVEQKRGDANFNYYLKLTDVYEHGWSKSKVTKLKTDFKNRRIVYTQYFPEKWLLGDYTMNATIFGNQVYRSGKWNLTLYDYSQTTTITRKPLYVDGNEVLDGQPLKVAVAIDRIGNMNIHVANILRGASFFENVLDSIINVTWRPGFAVVRPLINDLVSTAFTKIWSDSFKNFPFEEFVPT